MKANQNSKSKLYSCWQMNHCREKHSPPLKKNIVMWLLHLFIFFFWMAFFCVPILPLSYLFLLNEHEFRLQHTFSASLLHNSFTSCMQLYSECDHALLLLVRTRDLLAEVCTISSLHCNGRVNYFILFSTCSATDICQSLNSLH